MQPLDIEMLARELFRPIPQKARQVEPNDTLDIRVDRQYITAPIGAGAHDVNDTLGTWACGLSPLFIDPVRLEMPDVLARAVDNLRCALCALRDTLDATPKVPSPAVQGGV